MHKQRPQRQGIALKKRHGQHFLKNGIFITPMIDAVDIDNTISVMEIGCGEGVLTQAILKTSCKQLEVFEIDQEWANYVQNLYGSDPRLHVTCNNILEINWLTLHGQAPWVMLANLPYQITFLILHLIQEHKSMFNHGVVMVQEEVAQKIVKTHGRGYGYPSLFFQYHFEWKLLYKVPPDAFYPAPKVYSRLLYFKPKLHVDPIDREDDFWKFIKLCFHQPRRTLKNNLAQSHYALNRISDEMLQMRAQQLKMDDFLALWNILVQS